MGFWSSVASLWKANRNTTGARSRDLGPAAQSTPLGAGQSIGAPGVPFDVMRSNSGASGNPSAGIVLGTGADALGPLNPMRPIMPPEVAGRQWDYPIGANLAVTPRAYDTLGFPQLRNLAENCDVLRLVIETRKDQMAKLGWSIKPKLDVAGAKKSKTGDDPVAQQIKDFLRKPDGQHSFGGWLSMLLEDLFVVDAPAVYVHRTIGGKLLALEPIDGATLKRVIDDWGHTPEPPAPAYQQILKGMTAVDYTTEDLIYRPRVNRTFKMYGFSPVEQIALTVNIALHRALFQLNYYDEGTQPEGILSVPKEWTQKQVSEFQAYWDSALAGNLAARRRIRFVPGDVAKSFVPLREPQLTGQMDEWLARIVCFAFSISPQPFVSMMNRATAETSHDAAMQEGLAPLQNWVKELIDFDVIDRFWPNSGLEFEWTDDRQADPKDQETVITGYVSKGVITINEGRDQLGLDPIDGGDELRVLTATGYVKVGANDNAPDPGDVYDDQQKAKAVVASAPTPEEQQASEPSPKKEAQAAKAAGAPFRKSYWAHPPRRHDARHAAGGAGRS